MLWGFLTLVFSRCNQQKTLFICSFFNLLSVLWWPFPSFPILSLFSLLLDFYQFIFLKLCKFRCYWTKGNSYEYMISLIVVSLCSFLCSIYSLIGAGSICFSNGMCHDQLFSPAILTCFQMTTRRLSILILSFQEELMRLVFLISL